MSERKQEQVEQAELIQDLWLGRMIELLQSGEETSTDRATLIRWLEHNGWSVDPSRLPQELKDKLTSHIEPGDDIGDDVIPIASAM